MDPEEGLGSAVDNPHQSFPHFLESSRSSSPSVACWLLCLYNSLVSCDSTEIMSQGNNRLFQFVIPR